MIAEPQPHRLSPQEYLAWEATQDIKHEYLDGEVFAMTGGTIAHNLISGNFYALLKSHLRGKGCRVFIADVKVQVSERGAYFYPDVMVSCDERDRPAVNLLQHPCLIVEVLSPTTEAFDRGEKFRRYRQLPSLQEYVLIDATQISVDRFRRLSDKHWELQSFAAEDTLELTSIGWQGAIALLYEDVTFERIPPSS
ncbi:MAG: Uma2 family endonuclease [Cyanobacteriota bacterium]